VNTMILVPLQKISALPTGKGCCILKKNQYLME